MYVMFSGTAATQIYTFFLTLSLHDPLPIYPAPVRMRPGSVRAHLDRVQLADLALRVQRVGAIRVHAGPVHPGPPLHRLAALIRGAADRDRKSTRLNSSHSCAPRMQSSA